MPKRSSKADRPPKDPNQLAAFIVAQTTRDQPGNLAERAMHTVSTGEARDVQDARMVVQSGERKAARKVGQERKKNPAAVALGRLGGAKGGPARAAKLTAEQRKEIAQKAAAKRWRKPT